MNSPVNFNDPTGHESVCGQANSDPECGNQGKSPLSHPKNNTPPPLSPCTKCHSNSHPDESKYIIDAPQQSYHQCMTVCHGSTDPGSTMYVDIRTDVNVDPWGLTSGTIGLIGDAATALAILEPVPGDELVIGGGAVVLNGVANASTVTGFGIDVFQAAAGVSNTLGRDVGLFAGPKVLTSILKKAIPLALEKNPAVTRLVPLVGLPFHIKDFFTSINISTYTIPYEGSVP